jgi:hypothetical protein
VYNVQSFLNINLKKTAPTKQTTHPIHGEPAHRLPRPRCVLSVLCVQELRGMARKNDEGKDGAKKQVNIFFKF